MFDDRGNDWIDDTEKGQDTTVDQQYFLKARG
jgi:hypothetical protein